jgi:membrane associated rhomboid family serine protease
VGVTLCRVRTEDGEELVALDELEARLRAGELPGAAWIEVQGLTDGFVRVRDSPLAAHFNAVTRARFRAAFALDRPPWLALVVVLSCVALHVWAEARAGGAPSRDLLVEMGARARTSVLWDGEVWRLWSGALLHRDRWHLAFNAAVFLAVGGALESIYSRTAFVALLAWGTLCSALLSLVVGPAVTVGLSGVVFAALGACVGFGVRFRDVLRRPYQQWFGVTAVAYALFALWSSARRPEVDHPGHLGGLLAGLLLGLIMPPRRWRDPAALGLLDPGALVVAAAASVTTYVAFLVHAAGPVPLRELKVEEAALVVRVPAGFHATRDAFGLAAYDNGLDAQVALGCARAPHAWPRWNRGLDPAMAMVTQELGKDAGSRGVLDLRWHGGGWTTVGSAVRGGGWPAHEVALAYRVDGQAVAARLLAFERGLTRCALMLATRVGAAARRGPLLDRVRTHLQLRGAVQDESPQTLQQLSSPMLLDLGLAALQIGAMFKARQALFLALSRPVEETMAAPLHFALAQLGLLSLDVPLALEHAQRAHALAPADSDAALALYGALKTAGLGRSPRALALREKLAPLRPDVFGPLL